MNILGKEVSNKAVIIISSVLLIGVTGYILWRRKVGQELADELMKKLNIGTKGNSPIKVGYSTDEKGETVVWTSPTYNRNNTKMSIAQATAIAKTIASKIDGLLNRNRTFESSKIDAFKQIKTQAEGSKVLEEYTRSGGGSLIYDIKELKPDTRDTILNYLNKLPKK
jgi:hypothetical protein